MLFHHRNFSMLARTRPHARRQSNMCSPTSKVNAAHHMWPQMAPLVLASRQFSPKVEMFRQLKSQLHPEQQACCFVDIAGTAVTDAADITAAIKAAKEAGASKQAQVYAFDHVHPSQDVGKDKKGKGGWG